MRPLVALLALAPAAAAQSPLVTEFVASNDDGLVDEDGDRPDWIELHNPGPGPVDLAGWFLTDDDDELDRWRIPAGTVLPPGGFLVVFASGKDRAELGGPLHTSFALSRHGESLLLVRPDGATVAHGHPDFGPQEVDASTGLAFDGSVATPYVSAFALPTPGAPNGPGGPLVLDLEHEPAVPAPGEDVVVRARVPEDLGPTGAVELHWRVRFQAATVAPMRDDGAPPDEAAGDRVYAAAIPAGSAAADDLLRWAVVARSPRGTGRAPIFEDATDAPNWAGTVVVDPATGSALDTWRFFLANPGAADSPVGTRGAVFAGGRLYDNVEVHARGETSLSWPRKSLKVDFNRGDRFPFPLGGRLVDEVNLNTHYSDKAHLRQTLAFETHAACGALGPAAWPVRVERNGDFHGVATLVEEPDAEMLARLGLDPEGAFYKMYNGVSSAYSGNEKITRLDEDKEDLRRLVLGLLATGSDLERFLFDNVDVPACISYLAASWLIHDNDHVVKNYYLYRDTEGDGEWRFLPWDEDLTFGRNFRVGVGVLDDRLWARHDPQSHPLFGDEDHPKTDGPWNRLIDRLYATPRIRAMYLRRLRTLADDLLAPPGAPFEERWFEGRFREWQARAAADVALDEQLWGIPSWGRPRGFAEALARLQSRYLERRRRHLYLGHSSAGSGLVPDPEPPGIALAFGAHDHAQASPEEAYLRLDNPSAYDVDLSGWRIVGDVGFVLAPGTVVEAGGSVHVARDPRAFRARAVPPTGGEGNFVVGPFVGAPGPGARVALFDADGGLRGWAVLP